MEERSEVIADHKVEDVMLPGFRFHPTDEELVGFYLKRKIQQRPLSIELIKQLDIYKYDPWDLPNLAITGEKDWYFYCPRDRKYRNSSRPNRVTRAGFWKATGTDRPIYSSSHASNCIGLKKSLVFYKGRAARGVKTDWMMHEFRLPSDSTLMDNNNKNIPPNDSWAICRIFKKTNSAAQRAVSHSWVSSSSITAKDACNKTSSVAWNFANSYDPFDCFDGKLPQLSVPDEPFDPTFGFPAMETSDIAKSALNMGSQAADQMLDQFDASHEQPTDSFSPTLLHELLGHTEDSALLECPTNNMNVKDACENWEAMMYSNGCPLNCIWEKLLN